MDRESQKQIVEALILAAPEPVTAAQLADVVPRLKPAQARELIAELGNEYDEQGRAFEIWEVAGGYQIRTRPSFAPYLRQLLKERPARLSRAALETLSVIAYKQPVTRAEVELVRGVDVGAVLRSLVDRKLIRIAGHREVPGRPMLYATSRRFLEVFGLSKLDDLPTLREIEDLVPGEDEEPEETSAAPAQATTAPVVESSSELH
jgi:segregation and condensation protein B